MRMHGVHLPADDDTFKEGDSILWEIYDLGWRQGGAISCLQIFLDSGEYRAENVTY